MRSGAWTANLEQKKLMHSDAACLSITDCGLAPDDERIRRENLGQSGDREIPDQSTHPFVRSEDRDSALPELRSIGQIHRQIGGPASLSSIFLSGGIFIRCSVLVRGTAPPKNALVGQYI